MIKLRYILGLSVFLLMFSSLGAADLGSESNPATSCKEIKDYDSSLGSGHYWIEPENEDFEVFCDMETDGGGWTLVASAVDTSESSVFHYGGGDWTSGDDGDIRYDLRRDNYNQYVHDSPIGDVSDSQTEDTVLPSYYQLEFDQMMFTDEHQNYIGYDGMQGEDVSSWFENVEDTVDLENEENLVGSCNNNHCEDTIDDSFEPYTTNLNPSDVNDYDRFTLRFKSEDGDNALGNNNNHWKYGPAWDWQRNNNVNWDEGGFGWASAAEDGGGDYITNRGLGGTQNAEETDYVYWMVREDKEYEFEEFEIEVNGPDSGTPGYSQQYSTEITNIGSTTGEVGLLELTKNDSVEESENIGALAAGESHELDDFITFSNSQDYVVCGRADDIGEEDCMTVSVDESDGDTRWRRLVNFRLDLTGPDSGLGWDQDSTWDPNLDDYAPNQQTFQDGTNIVFTDIYWQGTYDVDNVGEDDLLDVHEPPMCGDDEQEYLLEEMGESINSEQNTGRYACADDNDYCVYRRPSGHQIFDRGETVNAEEDGEDVGRLKGDEAVCAQRPGLSDSSDFNRFPSNPHDLVPQWYDQDYANHINNDNNEGVRDVPDQNLCRENTLFGSIGVRWIPMTEIADNPHAFTEGIDDSWNPRLEQMNHPYYISDPEGEHWDGDENPLNATVPPNIDPDGDAEGITPVPTGVEDLYGGKVAAPTNMGYGFCVGDDSSEYLIHQESESRFIDTDTTVRGAASNPNKCMLDNSRFDIVEEDLERDNFEASSLHDERMIYDEGSSVSFDSGSDTRSVSCFNGRWWGEWPVVFLEDVSQTSLGQTGYSTFRVINPESSSRTIDLDLSFGEANEDVERMVSFSETDADEMTVDIPGATSRTYDIQIQAQGGDEIEAGDENTVELQGRSQRGDLDGYDNIDILVTDTERAGERSSRDVSGLQAVQLAILALIATFIFFFKD